MRLVNIAISFYGTCLRVFGLGFPDELKLQSFIFYRNISLFLTHGVTKFSAICKPYICTNRHTVWGWKMLFTFYIIILPTKFWPHRVLFYLFFNGLYSNNICLFTALKMHLQNSKTGMSIHRCSKCMRQCMCVCVCLFICILFTMRHLNLIFCDALFTILFAIACCSYICAM